jgi:hypothetical protein
MVILHPVFKKIKALYRFFNILTRDIWKTIMIIIYYPDVFIKSLHVCRAAVYSLNDYPGRSTVCGLREKKCRKK